MGPYRGGQAEYLRVPWADFNLLELPAGDEHEQDFTMLSDIFPTGYHGTELAGVEPGRTVAIFGAGPVGLMAAHSANIRGAAQTFVVDFQADRLALAQKMRATPISLADGDATEAIMDATDGFGVDCGVEAVGYQAHDPSGQEHPRLVLDALVQVVRATGKIGVVGVYEPSDEGAVTEDARHGRYDFDYGTAFTKGISIGSGQCPVMRYNRRLRDLIIRGQARPSQIVSHELPLDEAGIRLSSIYEPLSAADGRRALTDAALAARCWRTASVDTGFRLPLLSPSPAPADRGPVTIPSLRRWHLAELREPQRARALARLRHTYGAAPANPMPRQRWARLTDATAKAGRCCLTWS
jgi:NADPH:quinone reductase-like Zn-dependent oxidoreductase